MNKANDLNSMIGGLKLNYEESGYDSDSTRTGADSPDSEKVASQLAKRHTFCAADCNNVNLAFDRSKNILEQRDASDIMKTSEKSVRSGELGEDEDEGDTDAVTIVGDDDDSLKNKTNLTNNSSFDVTLTNDSTLTRKSAIDSAKAEFLSDMTSNRITEFRTPEKKKWIPVKSLNKSFSNDIFVNLLEDVSSPGKDTPPSKKIFSNSQPKTCPPKRLHTTMDLDTSFERMSSSRLKRPVFDLTKKLAKSVATSSQASWSRRELKNIKLNVDNADNLGISIHRTEAVRPYYVIWSMNKNGIAAKSKLFRIGDEIVRVSGRRLRGMSINEAKNALKNCSGTVEFQIARQPNFYFDDEDLLDDSWNENDTINRSRSESEIWGVPETTTIDSNDVVNKFEDESFMDMTMTEVDKSEIFNSTAIQDVLDVKNSRKNEDDDDDNERTTKKSRTCEIVSVLTKDGRTIVTKDEASKEEVTGMKKFQVYTLKYF